MKKDKLHDVWSARITEFKASGQSVNAWCADQDLKAHQLRYWLKKDLESNQPTEWVPLNLGEDSESAVAIRVGPVTIEVRPGFDPKLLLSVWHCTVVDTAKA